MMVSLKFHGFVGLWHMTDFSKSLQICAFQTILKMIKISWQSLVLWQKILISFLHFGIILNEKFLSMSKWLVPVVALCLHNTCAKKLLSLVWRSGFFVMLPPGTACNFKIYLGKVENSPEKGIADRVVFDLLQSYLDKNHHVYYDNFYSTNKLFQDFEKRNTFGCGTIRQKIISKVICLQIGLQGDERFTWRQLVNCSLVWWPRCILLINHTWHW